MILYFADRTLKIIGVASDSLASGVLVSDDTLTENVDSASDQFDFSLEYDYENRSDAEDMSLAGNYLFRDDGERIRLFTIIETEQDIAEQRISCYAEGIGLDFINDVKEKHEASAAHPIEWYFAQFCQDLEIRDNESTAQLKLSFEEQTLSERLNNLAEAFGVELSFDFEIENFRLKSRIVDIVNAVGTDRGEVVSLYTNLSDITVKRSIANLATALRVSGADNTDLNGYTPSVDSDFTLSGTTLMSGVALETWERAGGAGHICRSFAGKTNASDAAGKAALYGEAKEALIKAREPELNYEIKLTELPPDTKLGDVVNIVDDEGNLYVSSRLLELKTSITGQSVEATVGDFLIKESGISAKVEEMASEFARIADLRQFYTWVAYADNASGLNISLSPADKAYMGIKENQTVELTELSQITDPLILKWSKVEGDGGEDGTTFTPSVSSAGVISWTNDGEKENPPSQNIKGPDGKSAYEAAIEGGLPVSITESQFNTDLAEVPNKAPKSHFDYVDGVASIVSNASGYRTDLDGTGMSIKKGTEEVARFSGGAIELGKESDAAELELGQEMAYLAHYDGDEFEPDGVVLCNDDAVEYIPADPTEQEFNADKSKYFIRVNDEYVRCNENSSFVSGAYYIRTYGHNYQCAYIKLNDMNRIFINAVGMRIYTWGAGLYVNGYQIDYVPGSSGNWTWKRYSDGTFDAWYKGTVTCNDMTSFGSGTGLYAAEKILNLSNIFDFSISDATVSMTAKNTAGSGFVTIWRAFYTTTSLISSSAISFRVVGTAANAGDVTYDLYIHGTWS